MVSPLAGCTMYTRNEFLYGSQLGFQPRPVALHTPQTIQSNDPYSRVTRLMAELSRAAPSRWFAIQLVVAPNQCGMCTDGNTVYVDPNFISSFSDEELLGALAHELAHGDLGHIGMVQAAGLLVTGIFRVITKGHHVRDGTVIAHDLTQGFVMGQFSQKQELEADRQAKTYLDALGYDGTSAMIGVMGKLQALGGRQWASWFASHPAIPERIASLRDLHVATTASFPDGSPLQRSLGLIPPADQTPQPSPPVIAKAEGEIVSTSGADGGAMALEIKQRDGSTVPVVVGTGSVIYLNEENVTFKPFRIKPGMLADVEYTFDLQKNRSFASSLRLTSAKPVASPEVFPDKQKTLGAHIVGLYSSARKTLGFT
ncbi:MAG: M48 family metalloprotease, partial [Elusimicrobia bacterium]|nr:M48 family metalloprotease [Elusimicrobiota bacterium]